MCNLLIVQHVAPSILSCKLLQTLAIDLTTIPFQTLAAKLDLMSAFNKVESNHLLDSMENLEIPPCFGKFYKGFLRDRRFRVRIGRMMIRSA